MFSLSWNEPETTFSPKNALFYFKYFGVNGSIFNFFFFYLRCIPLKKFRVVLVSTCVFKHVCIKISEKTRKKRSENPFLRHVGTTRIYTTLILLNVVRRVGTKHHNIIYELVFCQTNILWRVFYTHLFDLNTNSSY